MGTHAMMVDDQGYELMGVAVRVGVPSQRYRAPGVSTE